MPVISVERSGGLLAPGQAFRTLPQSVVYSEGTTLTPGAVAAIYPGPPVPPIDRGALDEAEVDRLLAAAGEAGLTDGVDEVFGDPLLADAPITTVSITVGGETHVTSVPALRRSGPSSPGIGAAWQQARERITGFVAMVTDTVFAAAAEPYVAERYRVLPLSPGASADPAVPADERPWPFPDLALHEGECTGITGARATAFREVLRSATEITRWKLPSGATFVLAVRPVLPHEPDCPGKASATRHR